MDSVSNTAFVTPSRLRPRPFQGGALGGLLPFCGLLFVGTALAQAPGAPAARPAAGTVGRAAAPVAAAPAVTPVERFALSDATAGLKGGGPLYAVFELEQGKKPLSTLRCELYTELTPTTVANFVGLARGLRPFRDSETGAWVTRPFYDGLIFHRVVPRFVIQGGDPLGDGRGGPGYRLSDEIAPELSHDAPGIVAMANALGGGFAGSQFYITERPTPTLDGSAAIFGRVVEGMEVVRRIAEAPRVLAAGSSTITPVYSERPVAPISILRISVSRSGK